MFDKDKYLRAANELAKLLADQADQKAKRIIARAILVNLKLYLKQTK